MIFIDIIRDLIIQIILKANTIQLNFDFSDNHESQILKFLQKHLVFIINTSAIRNLVQIFGD
jgi:hypothetical protein